MEMNIKRGRISRRKNIMWGKISSGEEYPVGKNIKWKRISSGEEYQVEKKIQ